MPLTLPFQKLFLGYLLQEAFSASLVSLLPPNQSLPSQNPILKNITDYLIEEVSAEEEELLGSSGGAPPEEPPKEGNPAEINVERDEKLIKVPVRAECGMNKNLAWGGKGARVW